MALTTNDEVVGEQAVIEGDLGFVAGSLQRKNGGPCWIRTNDLQVKSPMLYQLS